MPCAPCAAAKRATEHRTAMQRGQEQRPYPWPAEIAAAFADGVRAFRRGALLARPWLQTQPKGPRQWASQVLVQSLEQLAVQAEQRLLRTGSN
jgi:hypothetical protein